MKRIEHDVLGTKPRNTSSINSKRKGNRNEVKLAHWLTAWTQTKFARTPASGGHHLKNSGSSFVCGDVVCGDENFNFPFLIETKHYKRFSLSKDLRSNSAIIRIYEDQAIPDAKLAKKIPLAFLRHNGMIKNTWYVVLDINLLENIECEILARSKTKTNLIVIHSNVLKNIGYECFSQQANTIINKQYK